MTKVSPHLKDLLLRMADDALVVAHRNSEWTGLGPILEEDIAFSSIAQDKLGHAYALYGLLHDLGEADPDQLAFGREAKDMKCCHLAELPIGGYDFSLMRHFLVDNAEALRYEMLESSTFEPLAKLARKVRGEIKYHVFHADNWIVQLGARGTDESRERMQAALNATFVLAFGMFELTEFESALQNDGIFAGEAALESRWRDVVETKLRAAGYSVPEINDRTAGYGGRRGLHTEHLENLVREMDEVFRIDPSAEW